MNLFKTPIVKGNNMTTAISFSNVQDIQDVEVQEAKKVANVADAFVRGINIDYNQPVVAVYNPYNPESLIASAILDSQKKDIKIVSFEDVIVDDAQTYIWIGVNKMLPSSGRQIGSKTRHVEYKHEQPAYHYANKHGFLKAFITKNDLTVTQLRENALIEYVNGFVDESLSWQEFPYVTLIDKIMFDFDIKDDGAYGYRYISILTKDWEKGKLKDVEEAGYYATLRSALTALEQSIPFKVIQGNTKDLEQFSKEISSRFKSIERKVTFASVPTVNGTERVAIVSTPPDMYYIAARHLNNLGVKHLNMVQGMNGRYFTGNVRIVKNATLRDKIEYVD